MVCLCGELQIYSQYKYTFTLIIVLFLLYDPVVLLLCGIICCCFVQVLCLHKFGDRGECIGPLQLVLSLCTVATGPEKVYQV